MPLTRAGLLELDGAEIREQPVYAPISYPSVEELNYSEATGISELLNSPYTIEPSLVAVRNDLPISEVNQVRSDILITNPTRALLTGTGAYNPPITIESENLQKEYLAEPEPRVANDPYINYQLEFGIIPVKPIPTTLVQATRGDLNSLVFRAPTIQTEIPTVRQPNLIKGIPEQQANVGNSLLQTPVITQGVTLCKVLASPNNPNPCGNIGIKPLLGEPSVTTTETPTEEIKNKNTTLFIGIAVILGLFLLFASK